MQIVHRVYLRAVVARAIGNPTPIRSIRAAAAFLSKATRDRKEKSLRSAAAPIKATPAEQKQQHDDQEN
jgi:hypothetical protein